MHPPTRVMRMTFDREMMNGTRLKTISFLFTLICTSSNVPCTVKSHNYESRYNDKYHYYDGLYVLYDAVMQASIKKSRYYDKSLSL